MFWGDVALLYFSLLISLLIRYGWSAGYLFNLQIHLAPFTIIFAVWLLVFYITNLYEIGFSKNNLQFYTALSSSVVVNALISIVFFYFVPYFRITPRTNLFIFLATYLVLLAPWRHLYNRLIAQRNLKNNTLILGFSPQSQELYDFLLANPQLGYNALGIIDTEHQTAPEVLENIIREKNVKTLILGPAAYKVPKIINILYNLVRLRMNFYNLSDFAERNTGRVPLGAIDQIWFLSNLDENSKRVYEFGKRMFDLLLATAIGLVFLPILPFMALAIKLDSKGNVFYRQARVGKAGETVTLIKFRTMFQDAEDKTGPVWAIENDNRTTRVGRFIRRTRIDEIPQIWNILKGEMSFVGPRPERPEFHEKLKKEIPFYEERYLIKPGLTGWAQIKYRLDFRGSMTLNDVKEKIQYDLYYIKNRSFLLDMSIILKTISIILGKILK